MEHGFAKLNKGPDALAGILHAIGVPDPHLMAWLTILVEIFGGLAVILGAFVSLASLPMAAVLFVAMTLWIQLDQDYECDQRPRPVWTAGL